MPLSLHRQLRCPSESWHACVPPPCRLLPTVSGPALDEADTTSYILSNFNSVAQLNTALNNGLNITWNSLFNKGSQQAFGRSYIPCHWGIWDKYVAFRVPRAPTRLNTESV